jgi:radical SAM protein with 4Fe4S-binding SPASM domain
LNRTHSPGLATTFTPAEIEAARKDDRLLSLDISLTRRCNLKCIYCYVGEPGGGDGELSRAEVTGLIDQALDLGLRTLNLTGGEPLIHEDYFYFAEYAVKKGLSVLLFTNGTQVTVETARRIAGLGISPCVKLDTLSPEIHHALTGNGHFDAARRAVDNLLEAGYGKPPLNLSINAVACRHNLAGIPALWRWARQRGITPFLTRLQPMGRASGKDSLAVSVVELKDLFTALSGIDRGCGVNWAPDLPWVYGKACHRHFIGAFITSTGTVQPCSGVPIEAGNTREKPLSEILRSPVFQLARNVNEHLEDACAACPQHDKCYGCRSLAYLSSGRFTAPDPLCWIGQSLAVTKDRRSAVAGGAI